MAARRLHRYMRVSYIIALLILASSVLMFDAGGGSYIKSMYNFRLITVSYVDSKIYYITSRISRLICGNSAVLASQLEESSTRSAMLSLHMQAIMQENGDLKRLLNYISQEPVLKNIRYVTGRVRRTLPSLAGLAYISIGTEAGVAIGQAVINEKGLVGRINNVSTRGAEILLVSDPRFRIPVVMRDSGEHAIFSGSALDFSRKQPKVFDGEMAITLGDYKNFLPSIPVGIVRISEGKLVSYTRIETFVDTAKLDYVLVIAGKM